ncbi:hypothetical protein QBC39DRAFT_259930 [Podospora conica]|nr:hypothetical protein QBC39DRAFT_259930 [Schizothecium conicum]
MVSSAQLARLEAAKGGPQPQTPRPTLVHETGYIQTPSSTVVEYGDPMELNQSASERADRVFRILSSHSSTPIPGHDEDDMDTPIASVETPIARRPRNGGKMVNDRISKFLNSLGQATNDSSKELSQENRNLQKRVVSLERNEQHLIKSMKEAQTAQRLQLEDELRKKQEALEARIKELEQAVVQKENRISELASQRPTAPCVGVVAGMSDADVATWYETRSSSWAAWVDEFAHDSSNRLAELHPLQQHEVYEGIRGFVRLTDDGKLPAPLSLDNQGDSQLCSTRLLLLGMLSDFFVTETLESPFWVFSALSKQGFDLESPVLPRSESQAYMSPMAFRLDLANWSNDETNKTTLASLPPPLPSPFNVPPAPTTARSISMLSPRHAPPVFTPMSSLSVNTKCMSLQYNLPARADMDDLLTLLSRTQQAEGDAISWRAQLMQTLANGGLSRDPCHPSMADNEDKQMLANARREYARQLRERFLGSAARFFLRDQDAQGIAKLEGRLTSEIDLALRFSAQVWSRPSPVHFVGLKQFGSGITPHRRFGPDDEVIELCASQRKGANLKEEHQVSIVLRPAIGTLKKIGGPGRVWAKAQVVGVPVSELPISPLSLTTPGVVVQSATPILEGLPSIQGFMAAKNARSPRPTATSPLTGELKISITPRHAIPAAEED